jgi:hypothetical protein
LYQSEESTECALLTASGSVLNTEPGRLQSRYSCSETVIASPAERENNGSKDQRILESEHAFKPVAALRLAETFLQKEKTTILRTRDTETKTR